MATTKKTEMEVIKPLVLTDSETGAKYELDFDRATVQFAERRGFKVDGAPTFPQTQVPELFYLAFRKNHRNVARDKTDKMLFEDLEGLTPKILARLIDLYTQASYHGVIRSEEDEPKNSKMTVELL